MLVMPVANCDGCIAGMWCLALRRFDTANQTCNSGMEGMQGSMKVCDSDMHDCADVAVYCTFNFPGAYLAPCYL